MGIFHVFHAYVGLPGGRFLLIESFSSREVVEDDRRGSYNDCGAVSVYFGKASLEFNGETPSAPSKWRVMNGLLTIIRNHKALFPVRVALLGGPLKSRKLNAKDHAAQAFMIIDTFYHFLPQSWKWKISLI